MTRDNNESRKKANAVFFSVIMVLSMFAIGFAGFAGTAAAQYDEVEPDEYDRVVEDGNTVYQGQIILIDIDQHHDPSEFEDVELRRIDDGSVGTLVSTPNIVNKSGINHSLINTANRDTDNYILTNASRGTSLNDAVGTEFENVVQDVSIEFDEDEVGNVEGDSEIDYEIESDIRNTYAVEISADGLDEDDLESIFAGGLTENTTEFETSEGDLNRSKIHSEFRSADSLYIKDDGSIILSNAESLETADFEDIDTGEYEFEIEVFDTTASDTASIEVVEGVEGELELVESNIDVDQGGIATITLATVGGADHGELVIGDEDDIGYQLNATIDFDGADEVELEFNTYAAGGNLSYDNTNATVLEVTSDDGEIVDDEVHEIEVDGILDVGDYQLAVRAGDHTADDALDNPDDLGSLFIDDRSTDSWNTWIAPDGEDIEDGDDIEDAIDEEWLTENGVVAHDDILVHQVEATGFDGLFGSFEDLDEGDALEILLTEDVFDNNDTSNGDTNLDLRIRETRESAGPNAERERVNVSDSSIDVIVDSGNVFLVMDTSDITFESNTAVDDEEDYEFEVRFRNQDYRLLDFDGDDDDQELSDVREQLDAAFEIEEAYYDFDEDPYNVTADDDVVFMGETNAAPGSEHTARLRSASGVSPRYNLNEDFTVGSDQTWASDEFDLSEASVGDEFTLSLRNTIVVGDNPAVDGNIVDPEPEDTPTDTPEDTPTDTPEDTPTDTPEDTPTDTPADTPTPDDTDDDTPGFGAVVALIALIAAALLATRRRP